MAGFITAPTIVTAAIAGECLAGAYGISVESAKITVRSVKKYKLLVSSYPARAVRLEVWPGVEIQYQGLTLAPIWAERREVHYSKYGTYLYGSRGWKMYYYWYDCHSRPSFSNSIYNMGVQPYGACTLPYTARRERYSKPWARSGKTTVTWPIKGWPQRWPDFYQ